jgi:hypothetical protein
MIRLREERDEAADRERLVMNRISIWLCVENAYILLASSQ